jgi:hypothetical protein
LTQDDVLVRRLAELHGAAVSVESMLGQGSCFTIALPYRPPPAPDAKLAALASSAPTPAPQVMRELPLPEAGRGRILLAEDNAVGPSSGPVFAQSHASS